MPEATSFHGFILWGGMWLALLYAAAWGLGAIGKITGLI